jgi:hypothetical protein
MKFVFKWLRKRLRDVEKEHEPQCDMPDMPSTIQGSSGSIDSNGTRFTVYKADGGHVVETRTYDRNRDSQTSLYIITEDQDFGDRISHILTYEAIKR